jgi:thioredoxin-like negative regulator of GroEL
MNSDSHIQTLHQLVSADRYDEADRLIQELRDNDQQYPELFLYEAICRYEEGNDLECLRLLTEFLRAAPKHIKRDYATFMAATCLVNVGLLEQSLRLLQRISSTYPARDDEMQDLNARLSTRTRASEYAEALEQALESA